MSEKKRHTAEQKIIILRELLENNTPISQVAEKYKVHVNDIYNWKKKLFENGTSVSKQSRLLLILNSRKR